MFYQSKLVLNILPHHNFWKLFKKWGKSGWEVYQASSWRDCNNSNYVRCYIIKDHACLLAILGGRGGVGEERVAGRWWGGVVTQWPAQMCVQKMPLKCKVSGLSGKLVFYFSMMEIWPFIMLCWNIDRREQRIQGYCSRLIVTPNQVQFFVLTNQKHVWHFSGHPVACRFFGSSCTTAASQDIPACQHTTTLRSFIIY